MANIRRGIMMAALLAVGSPPATAWATQCPTGWHVVCTDWVINPGYISGVNANDVLVENEPGLITSTLAAAGESPTFNHVAAFIGNGGRMVTHMVAAQDYVQDRGWEVWNCPLIETGIRYTNPGRQHNVDIRTTLHFWGGTGLRDRHNNCTGWSDSRNYSYLGSDGETTLWGFPYRLGGFGQHIQGGTCSQYLVDFCGVPAVQTGFTSAQVEAGASLGIGAYVFDVCMDRGNPETACNSARDQYINGFIDDDPWQCNGWAPRAIPNQPPGPISPRMIWAATPGASRFVATKYNDYATCGWWECREDECWGSRC